MTAAGRDVVEDCCRRGDWAGLVAWRERWRAGAPAGPAPAVAPGDDGCLAAFATYRLALEAPDGWLATALDGGDDGDGGRGWQGWPPVEVAAATRPWASAAGYLPAGVVAAFADERVLRGEDLSALGPGGADLPRHLAPWEPAYPVARYGPAGGDFPPPYRPVRPGRVVKLGRPGEPIGDPYSTEAVSRLAAPWTDLADAAGRMVVTEGRPAGALAALLGTAATAARLTPYSTAEALAWLGWTGAAGGPRGPRRGAAAGRAGAWDVVVALGGATEDWPLPAERVGALGAALRWWAWEPDDDDPPDGTPRAVRLVVEDEAEELSWAIELWPGGARPGADAPRHA